jgi:hypothetical protein
MNVASPDALGAGPEVPAVLIGRRRRRPIALCVSLGMDGWRASTRNAAPVWRVYSPRSDRCCRPWAMASFGRLEPVDRAFALAFVIWRDEHRNAGAGDGGAGRISPA